jgi:hypothetical protein
MGVVEVGVDLVAERDLELVAHLEQAPDADAVAVLAPRPVAVIGLGQRIAEHRPVEAEAEGLDVERHPEARAACPPGQE